MGKEKKEKRFRELQVWAYCRSGSEPVYRLWKAEEGS